MIIKNPDKLLKQWIPTTDGNLWFVDDVSVTMDSHGIIYIFRCIVELPVITSPNQQYYHSTRRVHKEVKLRLTETDYGKNNVYSVSTDEKIWRGYCSDIDTMNKFILVVADILPNTDNL
jgi:hypothetical protein